ncbi:UNVERIFIED_CONTAM: hypothetical protein FKN15_063197 [Acipenser sinensis]
MDEAASSEAWDSYESISENYTLEGSELHWLSCALYVACRKAVPTVSKGTVEGNYVSLTRILRFSEQSVIEFFSKMRKWEDMAGLSQEFRERTEKLERDFTVSAALYKKYLPIFQDVFRDSQEDPPRQHRSRKQRRQPCTVSELFNFCWILFVHAKDSVSYHSNHTYMTSLGLPVREVPAGLQASGCSFLCCFTDPWGSCENAASSLLFIAPLDHNSK